MRLPDGTEVKWLDLRYAAESILQVAGTETPLASARLEAGGWMASWSVGAGKRWRKEAFPFEDADAAKAAAEQALGVER